MSECQIPAGRHVRTKNARVCRQKAAGVRVSDGLLEVEVPLCRWGIGVESLAAPPKPRAGLGFVRARNRRFGADASSRVVASADGPRPDVTDATHLGNAGPSCGDKSRCDSPGRGGSWAAAGRPGGSSAEGSLTRSSSTNAALQYPVDRVPLRHLLSGQESVTTCLYPALAPNPPLRTCWQVRQSGAKDERNEQCNRKRNGSCAGTGLPAPSAWSSSRSSWPSVALRSLSTKPNPPGRGTPTQGSSRPR